MQENKDPAIKLFGQRILLQGEAKDSTISKTFPQGEKDKEGRPEVPEDDEADKESRGGKVTNTHEEKEEEIAKKADNKVLECPRCKSMDTKFCYYNNYNINQPRHFCKSCRRYWTHGGTIRNIPEGRRKNNNNNTSSSSSSHYGHTTIPNNGKVVNFGFHDNNQSIFHQCLLPSLGKHWRNGDMLKPEYLAEREEGSKQRNGGVLVAKSLRIDDPSEASIWKTLGMKKESSSVVSGGGMFESWKKNEELKKQNHIHGVEEGSHNVVLRANPASLCRSLRFHEHSWN